MFPSTSRYIPPRTEDSSREYQGRRNAERSIIASELIIRADWSNAMHVSPRTRGILVSEKLRSSAGGHCKGQHVTDVNADVNDMATIAILARFKLQF